MTLRVYPKWNIEGFCKAYFKEFDTDVKKPFPIHPSKMCNKENRCDYKKDMAYIIDEIQISMADCRIYAQKNKKMQKQYDQAVETIKCALECFNKEPGMSAQDYIDQPTTLKDLLLPVRSIKAFSS